MTNALRKIVGTVVVMVSIAGCDGSSAVSLLGPGQAGNVPGAQPGTPGAAPTPLLGTAGRDLTEHWETLDVPLSAHAKMLAFDMMKGEVKRATGLSWISGGVDQWEGNRAAFGGADYVTTFAEDITPSQSKIVIWRRMAYQVCLDAVNQDAGKAERKLFTQLDPGAAISETDPLVGSQISKLYERFFLDLPSDAEASKAKALLLAAYADGKSATEAWRGLCVGYLGSMRFLTY